MPIGLIIATVVGLVTAGTATYHGYKRALYRFLDRTTRFGTPPPLGAVFRNIRLRLHLIKVTRSKLRKVNKERDQLIVVRENQLEGGQYNFVNRVACEVVGRMGGRPCSNAQQTAARILAFRIMREKDHRYAHCDRDIPKVMIMVLSPTLSEQEVEEFTSTTAFTERFDRRELSLAATSLGVGLNTIQ